MLRVYPISSLFACLVGRKEKECQDPNPRAEQSQKGILLTGTSGFQLFPYIPIAEGTPGTLFVLDKT